MQFFNDNQCQSKEYTGATEKVGSVLGGRSFSLMTPTNNGHTIRIKSEDGDEEEQVVLSAFPAESNGGDDTVGTNGGDGGHQWSADPRVYSAPPSLPCSAVDPPSLPWI